MCIRDSYYTDQAGEIVLTGLEPGTTVIAREVKTVDGYVLDGTPQDILIKACLLYTSPAPIRHGKGRVGGMWAKNKICTQRR